MPLELKAQPQPSPSPKCTTLSRRFAPAPRAQGPDAKDGWKQTSRRAGGIHSREYLVSEREAPTFLSLSPDFQQHSPRHQRHLQSVLRAPCRGEYASLCSSLNSYLSVYSCSNLFFALLSCKCLLRVAPLLILRNPGANCKL